MSTEQVILRLLISLLIGGIIGAEREYQSKSAGFRTLMLISLGSTIFTIMSITIGANLAPDRIASNIVTGIGFVGAGVIFRNENRMNGITTAATIWVTAAWGMAIGAGHFAVAITGSIFTLLVLVIFHFLETRIDLINQLREYTIVCEYQQGKIEELEKLFIKYGLSLKSRRYHQKTNEITCFCMLQGAKKNHQLLVSQLLQDTTIIEFIFDGK